MHRCRLVKFFSSYPIYCPHIPYSLSVRPNDEEYTCMTFMTLKALVRLFKLFVTAWTKLVNPKKPIEI